MQNIVMLHIVIGVNVIFRYSVDDIIVSFQIIIDTSLSMHLISCKFGDILMRLLTVMVILGILR